MLHLRHWGTPPAAICNSKIGKLWPAQLAPPPAAPPPPSGSSFLPAVSIVIQLLPGSFAAFCSSASACQLRRRSASSLMIMYFSPLMVMVSVSSVSSFSFSSTSFDFAVWPYPFPSLLALCRRGRCTTSMNRGRYADGTLPNSGVYWWRLSNVSAAKNQASERHW